jgi:hypothetical protein
MLALRLIYGENKQYRNANESEMSKYVASFGVMNSESLFYL